MPSLADPARHVAIRCAFHHARGDRRDARERLGRLRIVEIGEHLEALAVVMAQDGEDEGRERGVAVGRHVADAQPAARIGRVRGRHVRGLPFKLEALGERAVQREYLGRGVPRRQLRRARAGSRTRGESRGARGARRRMRRTRRRIVPGPCTGCRDCSAPRLRPAQARRASSSSATAPSRSPTCCRAFPRLTRAPTARGSSSSARRYAAMASSIRARRSNAVPRFVHDATSPGALATALRSAL